MYSLAQNPINLRLRKGSRWPSEGTACWLGIGLGVIIGLGTELITQRFVSSGEWSIRLGAEPLVVVVCLTACFVLSAASMAGSIQAGDYALLRLSSLFPSTIVDGYTEGILYRLRLLRALAAWSPVGWGPTLLLGLPSGLSAFAVCAFVGVGAVWVIGAGHLVVRSLGVLMVSAGVWFALRMGAHAGALAAGAGAVAGSALVISIGAVFAPGLFRCCAPMLAVVAIAVLDSRRGFFYSDAVRAVEEQGWPGIHPEVTP